MRINISKSGNSFMTGGGCYQGRRKKNKSRKDRSVFSQGVSRKHNNRVAVDVFIYVFVNEATGESMRQRAK